MTSRAWPTRVAVSLIVLIAALAVTSRTGAAHKPVTSKYTFNEDVFPIFRDKCGRCPRGSVDQQIPKVVLTNTWALGPPDVTLDLPEVTLAADKMESTQEFTVATGTAAARWIRATDLLPGTPSVVRSAVIAIKGGQNTELGAEHVLRRWLPGQDIESIDRDGAAFKLPPNAVLSVTVHYKKTWQAEGQSPKDKSTIGLYFATQPNDRELLVVPITGPLPTSPLDRTLTFTHTIDRGVDALALSPDDVPPDITLTASAVLPNGNRVPLVRMHTRADWARRYWFERPIPLPAGTRIEVVANLDDPDQLSSEAFGGFAPTKSSPGAQVVKLSLDVTSG